MSATQHIRRPQPKARGNQYRLDRTIHPVVTFCGAEGTTLDLVARRNVGISKADRAWPGTCRECLAVLESEEAAR